jgi:hypothetical protein
MMKKSLINAGAFLCLTMMAAVASVSAQTAREMTVEVPFEFTVGDATLPAGVYGVYRTSTQDQILMRRRDGNGAVLIVTDAVRRGRPAVDASLEFRRYGDQYYLARIWTKGEQIGRKLAPSRRERRSVKEATRNLAQAGAKPEIVSVVAE